jgi:hypothetical protein
MALMKQGTTLSLNFRRQRMRRSTVLGLSLKVNRRPSDLAVNTLRNAVTCKLSIACSWFQAIHRAFTACSWFQAIHRDFTACRTGSFLFLMFSGFGNMVAHHQPDSSVRNSAVQISWKSSSLVASRDIPCSLWTAEAHCLVRILNQVTPIHAIPIYLQRIQFHTALPTQSRS